MRIVVQDLILEVTRRCNMCCDHCLRGCAENMDMKKETVDKVLDSVDEIGTITFTGGEPTLNLPVIRYFFEEAEKRGKLPYSFFIATNGKENQLELAKLLLEWFPKMEDPDVCGVTVSRDIFHEDIEENYLKGLSFCNSSKDLSKEKEYKWVLNRGRAYEFGIGENNRKIRELYYEFYPDIDECSIEQMYVSADENILGDCDLPFKEQEENRFSTLDELRTVLEKKAAEEE